MASTGENTDKGSAQYWESEVKCIEATMVQASSDVRRELLLIQASYAQVMLKQVLLQKARTYSNNNSTSGNTLTDDDVEMVEDMTPGVLGKRGASDIEGGDDGDDGKKGPNQADTIMHNKQVIVIDDSPTDGGKVHSVGNHGKKKKQDDMETKGKQGIAANDIHLDDMSDDETVVLNN